MKTHNLKLTALILVLTIAITGQSFGHNNYGEADEKKVVKINMKAPLIKFITRTLDVSPEDLNILKEELNEVNFFLVGNSDADIEITLVESAETEPVFVIEYGYDGPELEDWMFDDDYLYTEAEPVIEDWMYEGFANPEAEPTIEDWMYEEDYLNTEATPIIEDWMYEEDYLNTEAIPLIESWMMDEDYLSSECCPEIEGWMFETEYYSTEAQPEIESWMMDDTYFE